MPFDEQDGEDGPSANLDMVVDYNERNVKLWFHVLEDKMRAKGVLRYGHEHQFKWLFLLFSAPNWVVKMSM